MRKCKGCGIILQNKEKEAPGYVVDLEQDYCKRCFRLIHYGDISEFRRNQVSNEKIYAIYRRYASSLFVLIIDVFDALCLKDDDLLEVFKDYQLLIVVNKTDLLPENVSEKKIDRLYSDIFFRLSRKYPNIRMVILSNKFEKNFNDQFFGMLESQSEKNIVFAGRANAGKSSLINKLLMRDELTTSLYPGTTLDEVEINYRGYRFIDTPGLIDNNDYSTYLNLEKYRLSRISKTIRPQIFQLKQPQSYFYEGLLRVDIIPKDSASIIFYINNDNRIHRTRYENGDDYYQRHYCEFVLRVKPLAIREYSIDTDKTIIIKGLGMIRISGCCLAYVHALADIRLFESEVEL